jgi:hypothetical protein
MHKRILLVACLGLLVSRPAWAEGDDRARAAASFHRGQVAYARHDYAEAAAAFELAAGFDLNAVALLDAADAWALAGQPVRAAEDCDRALALPGLTAEQRHFAESRLAAVDSSIGTLDVDGPADVRVTLDDGAEVPAPVRRRVATGRHVVRMRSATDGRSEEQTIVLGGGDQVHLSPSLHGHEAPPSSAPPVVPPASPPPGSAGLHVPTLSWVSLGVAVAAAGTAIGLGELTLHDRDVYDASKTDDNRSAAYRARTATDVAWAVAGASFVTGGLVWIFSPKHAATQSSLEVGRGVGYRLRF